MINNTTVENKYPTNGNLDTVYPITFEGATDEGGLPLLKVVITTSDESREIVYNIGYVLAYDETQEDNNESLNEPHLNGIKLLNAADAVSGNTVTITRTTPFVQPIDYQVGRIDPEQVERGFDLSVLRDQEIRKTADDADEKSDSAVETANDAKEVADEASELVGTFDARITQNTEDIAAIIAGGSIDNITIKPNANNKWEVQAIRNQNTEVSATQPVYDWVGTSAEYVEQDVANLHPEWLCFIIDDVVDLKATYVFDQGVAATTWTVTHNLNKYPSVTVVDSAGTTVDCTVTYISSNECQLNFNAAFKGKAYLN